MLKRWWILFLFLVLLIPAACAHHGQSSQPSSAQTVELMVVAAASLKDALEEMKPSFAAEHPHITLTYVFGSSGKLAQQIIQGAPADVFLSASTKDMDTVQAQKLIDQDTRVDFAQNELVLIARQDSTLAITSFEEIDPSQINHFAIGEPKSVPAGRYAEETFQHVKLWDQLQSKLVMGSDVRQVLTYVESGNAELGVVYASDAVVSNRVKVLATAKPEWHQPIVYPGAVIENSSHKEEAKAFLAYLSSDKGKEILQQYGFR